MSMKNIWKVRQEGLARNIAEAERLKAEIDQSLANADGQQKARLEIERADVEGYYMSWSVELNELEKKLNQ